MFLFYIIFYILLTVLLFSCRIVELSPVMSWLYATSGTGVSNPNGLSFSGIKEYYINGTITTRAGFIPAPAAEYWSNVQYSNTLMSGGKCKLHHGSTRMLQGCRTAVLII